MHHAGIELTIWYISYIYFINILSTIAFSILWNSIKIWTFVLSMVKLDLGSLWGKWRAGMLLAFNSHLWHKLTDAWSHSTDLQSILVEPQPDHVTDHILIVMHGFGSCYGVRIHGWHAGAFTLTAPQISERSHQTFWKIIFDLYDIS